MSTVTDFYSNPDLADGFGSTAYPRTNSHRGLDFAKGLGTTVPALAGGTVIKSEWHAALGNIVEVRGDDGRFIGYRHLRTAAARVSVGVRVEQGSYIGQVSDTGSAAFGYHLCTTNASAPGGVYGDIELVTDPWPWIQFYVFGGPNPGGVTPTPESGMEPVPGGGPLVWPVGEQMARLQRALSARGRYNYDDGSARPDDGEGGENTAIGVQITLNVSGRFGGITVPNFSQQSLLDGKLGTGAAWGVQEYAKDFGGYKNVQDGDPRFNSWQGFIIGLETD